MDTILNQDKREMLVYNNHRSALYMLDNAISEIKELRKITFVAKAGCGGLYGDLVHGISSYDAIKALMKGYPTLDFHFQVDGPLYMAGLLFLSAFKVENRHISKTSFITPENETDYTFGTKTDSEIQKNWNKETKQRARSILFKNLPDLDDDVIDEWVSKQKPILAVDMDVYGITSLTGEVA